MITWERRLPQPVNPGVQSETENKIIRKKQSCVPSFKWEGVPGESKRRSYNPHLCRAALRERRRDERATSKRTGDTGRQGARSRLKLVAKGCCGSGKHWLPAAILPERSEKSEQKKKKRWLKNEKITRHRRRCGNRAFWAH